MNEYKQNDQKFLDDLLDQGLAQYAKSEACPGLETRILANVTAEQSHGKETFIVSDWPWTRLGWATAIFIFAVGTTFVIWNHQQDAPKAHIAGGPTQKPAGVQSVPENFFGKHKNNMNTAHTNHVIPTVVHMEEAKPVEPARLAMFPSPSPLSEQEKYFLQFLKTSKRDDILAMSHPDIPVSTWENKSDDDRTPNESRLKNTGYGIENVKF